MTHPARQTRTGRESGWSIETVDAATPVSVRLDPPGPVRIGRRSNSDIVVDDPRASREHAVLEFQGDEEAPNQPPGSASAWTLTDTDSRHGTWVNGVKVQASRPVPLRHGDVISIAGRTFRMVNRAAGALSTTLRFRTRDDMGGDPRQTISTISGQQGSESRQQRWLRLLLACAQTLREADGEQALAEAVLDAAAAGVDAPNLAFLGPMGEDAEVDVLAHRGDIATKSGLRVSRTLLREAALGEPVRLTGDAQMPSGSHSIMSLGIDEAVCVPLTLGPGIAAYLYADRRGSAGAPLTTEACEYLVGLGRMASLALADLKRRDLERRQARVDADLAAAGEAHRFILPPRRGQFGSLSYVGESRPGQAALGGDFFDIVELPGGRIGVALGDVSGKGVAASVLMTSTQGFLHAALMRHADPARAISDLNTYLVPRKRADRFVTLWLGVFDPREASLVYVDAGHGHAVLIDEANDACFLREAGGPLVGLAPGSEYESATVAMNPGSRVLVVSDGLVEQQSPEGDEFSLTRVTQMAAAVTQEEDLLSQIFVALHAHADSPRLADDATAVLVYW
jgi:serine phosphatase RsbU (regulator of sigma subunit)